MPPAAVGVTQMYKPAAAAEVMYVFPDAIGVTYVPTAPAGVT